MDKNSIMQKLKGLEDHIVLVVSMPGYKQIQIGQISTRREDVWQVRDLFDTQRPLMVISLETILKVSLVQTWDSHDAVIYIG